MKRSNGFVAILVMVYLLNIYAVDSQAQNLRFSGAVTDANSRRAIEKVSIYGLIDNRKKLLTNTDSEGKFTFEYPNDAMALVVEKDGYRVLRINAEVTEKAAVKDAFYLMLPLIPLDKQVANRPYMQSEQKDFVLNTLDSGKVQVTRLFKIKDAITSQNINVASICFEYTKVEKKDCKDITPANPSQKVSFVETDIINMVVESAGYQTYRGNLILDKMDGSNSVYEVMLTPEVTILTINVKSSTSPLSCTLTDDSGKNQNMIKGTGNSYYALTNEGDFKLNISNSQGAVVYSGDISLQKGLNYKLVTAAERPQVSKPKAVEPEKSKAVNASIKPLPDSTRQVLLYFAQSDHKLLPEAKEKLDQLILWLSSTTARKIRIEGHSDNVGDPRRNEVLSEYRARVAFNYLLQNGITREKMTCAWKGGKKPVEKNDSEENKRKNRRVEITLIPEK